MKHQNSSQARLETLVKQKQPGEIIFPADYFDIGSPESVTMAFSRLAGQKALTRLGKGIYLKPKFDPQLGELRPSLEEIARKIATKERVVIRPTGSYALNKLGLSTQVPTRVAFLTNGSPRAIKVGRGTISFKSTTPKKLAAANETVFLAIQALIELGEKGTTEKVLNILGKALERETPASIREGAKSAPNRVARILYTIADKIEKDAGIFAVAGRQEEAHH